MPSCASENERICRHNSLRDHVHQLAGSACLNPVKEARSLVPGSKTKPGDVYLPCWKGRPAALDVTVTSPLCNSYVRQAALTTGAALDLRKIAKRREHHNKCQRQGVAFFPLVVETLGGWDSEGADLIRAMSRQAAIRSNTDPSTLARHTFQRMGILLQRANALLLAARGPPAPPDHLSGVN